MSKKNQSVEPTAEVAPTEVAEAEAYGNFDINTLLAQQEVINKNLEESGE